jgi:hypothetical protein
MTAVCLYGTSGRPLTLRISPWLKEFHFARVDKGNLPQPLPEQVKLFEVFLQYVPASFRPSTIQVVLDYSDFVLYDSGKIDPAFQYGEQQYYADGIRRFYETHQGIGHVRAVAHGTLMKQFPGLTSDDKLKLKTKQNLWSMEIHKGGETCTIHPGVPYPTSKHTNDPICKYNTFILPGRSTLRTLSGMGGRSTRRRRNSRKLRRSDCSLSAKK